jgi:hypothetical protein
MTADVSRMIVAGQKEIFMDNFDPFPIEYPAFTTAKKATKKVETYDSMGNLQAASEKVEGDAIQYGKVGQAYQTSITNKTWANGYSVTLEATKYDLYGCINSVKAKELSRTMRECEETEAITEVDNAFTTNLADGVHKTMIKMFADFKNHAGGKIKTFPTNGLTHVYNMMDIEEVYSSTNKANELSNTKNSLPKIKWDYSTYLADTNAWMMYDRKFENFLFQKFMDTVFDNDEDKISTKNLYLNAIAIYKSGTLPAIGCVGNAGA